MKTKDKKTENVSNGEIQKTENDESVKVKNEEVKPKFKKKSKVLSKTGSFFAEFKKFISKGNIIDLSIAVVIGTAFNKIVSSLVNNIIMPLISVITGGVSVADWKWVISPATYDETGKLLTNETALCYGIFIQAIIDFLIIALTIFVVLKIITNSRRGIKSMSSKLKKKNKNGEPEEVIEESVGEKIETSEDILKDIRTLLTNNANNQDN